MFLPVPFSYTGNYVFCVCQISIHSFIIELQYNHNYINFMTLNYTLYILHIKSTHTNFEVIMNACEQTLVL